MTKRERQSLLSSLEKAKAKLAKKRDEVRELVSEIKELISSAEDGSEELSWAVEHIESAMALQDVADISSFEAEHVARAIIHIVQAEQREQDTDLPAIGQDVRWVGPDGDMLVPCKVIAHVEGWVEVEFADHSAHHYSRAIVRPSSVGTRIENVDKHVQQITAIRKGAE